MPVLDSPADIREKAFQSVLQSICPDDPLHRHGPWHLRFPDTRKGRLTPDGLKMYLHFDAGSSIF
jgi:hypothetical protein